MKPTSNTNRQFPLIEWYYRSEPKADTSASPKISNLPSLYRATGNFLSAELARDYFAEMTVFALISAISAWPIFFSLISIVRMVRGY